METQLRSPPGGPHHVRLPPVTVREDLLEAQGFNPGRRVSITEPSLHAYGQSHPADPSQNSFARRHSPEDQAALMTNPEPVKQESTTPEPPHSHHGGRYGQGPGSSTAGPALNYEFGSSFGQTGQHTYSGPTPLPPPNYRFGGPSSTSQTEGPSFFDYSMRRHSLTNSQHPPPPPPPQPHPLPSPQRLPSMDAGVPQLPSPGGHLKRKTSAEEAILEHGAYYSQNGGYHQPGTLSQPYPKRRGSSLTYDKMNSLSLGEQHRRDSLMSGGMSSWEDDRRGSGTSGTSYNTNGSPAYSMGAYSMAQNHHHHQQPSIDYDHRGSPLSAGSYGPPPAAMSHRQHPEQQVYDQQVSHSRQSSINMGPPVHPNAVDEDGYSRPMGYSQGPNAHYHHQDRGGPGGPMITHSPPENGQPAMVSPVDGHPPPTHRTSSGSYAALPPAQAAWARAGPLPSSVVGGPRGGPNGRPSGPPRQGSGSSLDPHSAYGPGGPMKETPYSRSPELRVSHKLAERKRRKEMAQLFDDLRDALPVNRGLKASKWEILSKAVDFILGLKEHNTALVADNTMLRQHFGLGPGPQAPPGLEGDGPSSQDQLGEQAEDDDDHHQVKPTAGRGPSPGASQAGGASSIGAPVLGPSGAHAGAGADDEDEDELEG